MSSGMQQDTSVFMLTSAFRHTLTLQSGTVAKLLYYIFTDCSVLTQLIQMLQPIVTTIYLPLRSDKGWCPAAFRQVLSALQSTTAGTRTCSPTYGKKLVWSILKHGYSHEWQSHTHIHQSMRRNLPEAPWSLHRVNIKWCVQSPTGSSSHAAS
jgi:hypothetical protein